MATLCEMVAWGVDISAVEPRSGFCVLHAACLGGQADMLARLLDWSGDVPTLLGPVPLRDSLHQPLRGTAETCRCVWTVQAAAV